MSKLVAKILFFPLAVLGLGAAYQAVQPEGLWTLRSAEEAHADGLERVRWTEVRPKISSGVWLLVDARDEEQFNAQPARVSPRRSPQATSGFPANLGRAVVLHRTQIAE